MSILLRQLRSRMDCGPTSLDDWRTLVIQAGQLEQGLADCKPSDTGPWRRIVRAAMRLTDNLAAEFYVLWAHSQTAPVRTSEGLRTGLRQLGSELQAVPGDPQLTIKVPEGFAFYALFPEQYCAAALAWAAGRARFGRVLVVGIRSIGTSLSAVVKETLAAEGWNAQRTTVRPTGHPFQRRVELDLSEFRSHSVIVVDEGPGISGSSMASVAQACSTAGVRDVSFLPGHGGGPGASASAEIQAVWDRSPRYVTAVEAMKWNELFLPELLARKAQELQADECPFDAVEDVSGGQWRNFAFADEAEWPAVVGLFERMKYLCVRRNGTSVLWKFAGLHCAENGERADEAVFRRLSARGRSGFCPLPLGSYRGFIALPWIKGMRLTHRDGLTPSVLERIGNYILDAAGPTLSPQENEAAITRLAEMLYWNTKEALGDDLAERSRALADAARRHRVAASYGDGHLAPHEWIRTSGGPILKTDGEGHMDDHTLIGRQSVLWDIAGALVEWNLSTCAASPLLTLIERAIGQINSESLAFYHQAYAGFRHGLLSVAIQQTSDTAERSRLRTAGDFYLKRLAQGFKAAAVLCEAER